jgi:hypothetical protein
MYFNYDNLEFRYSPFPIGLAKPLMDPALYKEMLASYPDKEHFIYKEKLGHKYTLSEHFNPKDFHRFIRTSPVWSDFYRWLKSRDFTRGVLEVLVRNSLDLGYDADMTVGRQLRKRITNGNRLNWRAVRLKPRFKFSMVDEGKWDPTFGDDTDVNQPKDEPPGRLRGNGGCRHIRVHAQPGRDINQDIQLLAFSALYEGQGLGCHAQDADHQH